MADVAVTVRQAIRSEQGELIDQEEHCSMDARTIAALGIADRRQVRITAAGRRAIYTLSETRDETADGVVRMGLGGRRRLGQDDVFEAAASAAILDPDLPDQRAEAEGRFVERLADDGAQKALIIVAPHGGGIEPHTDEQAAGVAARFPADQVSTWVCQAFEPHALACHITSSDLHPRSFPLLRRVIDRGFLHAVSFHGFDQSGILVGGAAPASLRQEIVDAIAAATAGSGVVVRAAEPNESFGGDDAANVVNRLTRGGANGVQIEQCLRARQEHGQAIASAVADVYTRVLARAGQPVAGS